MSADDSLDQPSSSLPIILAARYPQWTIWYGQATKRWWALPPAGRDSGAFVEAKSVKELVESIEALQVRRRTPPASPNAILFGEAETSRAGRVPAAVRPLRGRR